MLLPAASIHTFGCSRPVLAVAVSRDGVVLGHETVSPGSIRWFRGARWVLELDAGAEPPPPHAPLDVVASS